MLTQWAFNMVFILLGFILVPGHSQPHWSYLKVHVMINLCCQLNEIENAHGNEPMGMTITVQSGSLNVDSNILWLVPSLQYETPPWAKRLDRRLRPVLTG